MASKIYQQVSKERYEIILGRYKQFQKNVDNPDSAPVRVFDPLDQRLVNELELIREVSRELQAKKEEDVKKAAQQAASQAEEEAKKAAEEKEQKEKEEKDQKEKEEKEAEEKKE